MGDDLTPRSLANRLGAVACTRRSVRTRTCCTRSPPAENGANSSFVNRITDEAIAIDDSSTIRSQPFPHSNPSRIRASQPVDLHRSFGIERSTHGRELANDDNCARKPSRSTPP
jgi:hypothetical protein